MNKYSILKSCFGGAIAGVRSTIANAAVKDVIYTVITDLQILEKAGKGARIQ